MSRGRENILPEDAPVLLGVLSPVAGKRPSPAQGKPGRAPGHRATKEGSAGGSARPPRPLLPQKGVLSRDGPQRRTEAGGLLAGNREGPGLAGCRAAVPRADRGHRRGGARRPGLHSAVVEGCPRNVGKRPRFQVLSPSYAHCSDVCLQSCSPQGLCLPRSTAPGCSVLTLPPATPVTPPACDPI